MVPVRPSVKISSVSHLSTNKLICSRPFMGYYYVCVNGVVICTLHSIPLPAKVRVVHVAEWWREFMMLALLYLCVSHTIFVLLNESPGSNTDFFPHFCAL
jgi:hypothetical protein